MSRRKVPGSVTRGSAMSVIGDKPNDLVFQYVTKAISLRRTKLSSANDIGSASLFQYVACWRRKSLIKNTM
jgi:hypothetical protein